MRILTNTKSKRVQARLDPSRESFIFATALHVAIGTLSKLPDSRRPDSDIEDMNLILGQRFPGMAAMLRAQDDFQAKLDAMGTVTDEQTACLINEMNAEMRKELAK